MTPDVDIEHCAREPIHIPGAVQPHGALLVLGEPNLTILQASRSCGSLLGREPERLLGRSLSELFGAGQIAPILRDLSPQGIKDQNPLDLLLLVEQEPRRYEAIAHRHDGLLMLELERAPLEKGPSSLSFYQLVSQFISRLQATATAAQATVTAAEQIAQLSGFDRVMIYRFDQNWDGEVVAEVTRKGMEPYLGLCYPASDIPAQARRLFTLNQLRLIADVDYIPSPIVPQDNPRTGRPSDLSLSLLRSASPVHIEYLRNMGVKATLTISILVEGSLWGLIACHHGSPRQLPHQVRTACEFLGQIVSLHITTVEAREDRVHRTRLQQVHERIALALCEGDLFAGLNRSEDSLLQLTGSGGAAVSLHDRMALFGTTPTEEQTLALIHWLRGRCSGPNSDMLNTKCLSEIYPAAEAYRDQAAGLLALPLLQDGAGFVLWFRPEVIRTVSWAGDPSKSMQPGESGRLHPRRSFALWQEILSRHSAPFRSWEIAAAVDVRHAIISKAAQDEKRATDVAVGVAQAATRELQAAQQLLVATARQAGMAEIATGILHNVGNALNSVNVSATTIPAIRELLSLPDSQSDPPAY